MAGNEPGVGPQQRTGNVVGLDIDRASQKLDLKSLENTSLPALNSMLNRVGGVQKSLAAFQGMVRASDDNDLLPFSCRLAISEQRALLDDFRSLWGQVLLPAGRAILNGG